MALFHIDLDAHMEMRDASEISEHSVLDSIESNFLIYLLKRFRPKKMVEVGVWRGGTSSTILKNTKENQFLYGIDISSNVVGDIPIGHVVQDVCNQSQKDRFTLYTGKDPVDVIQSIGDEIDFVYIDTTHALPGELLQFFVLFKYLRKGAVLLLHDLILNSFPFNEKNFTYRREAFGTKVLFCSLYSRQKFVPKSDFPNIGAVIIDDLTFENIESTFMLLSLSWFNYPQDIIKSYKKFIAENYSNFCSEYFNKCIEMQKKLVDFKKNYYLPI